MKTLGIPDRTEIILENDGYNDAKLRIIETHGRIQVFIKAIKSRPRFIELFWNNTFSDNAVFLGDVWERSYRDLSWKKLESTESMPWYFLCCESQKITAAGVMTGPASFVSFSVSSSGIKALLDVRCGGTGVALGGRELLVAEFISHTYSCPAFDAVCDFCSKMCPNPILPPEPVYGGNNWYYAYGESSKEDILKDAEYQSLLSKGLENRPFMVIDDGWSVNKCAGPWIPNKKFGDMADIANQMKKMGVRPGIWVRLLRDDVSELPQSWRLVDHAGSKNSLDPSNRQVLEYVSDTIKQFVSWGYELIKHDFTTYDIIGKWGFSSKDFFADDGWSFGDKTRTTAEIMLDLYKTILDAAGDSLILGCNTVSHLGAGLLHISRIGDDTSGYEWERTYQCGVNTLAFRLPQHNRFYAIDADCVGFKGIPWEKNSQWLTLLSVSGTPLFISCPKDALDNKQFDTMRNAYEYASVQDDLLVPVDWFETPTPQEWKLNGKKTLNFNWK